MRVRFLSDSRHEDWKKGQLGEVVKTLATPPQNQFTIYIVELEDGKQVWATNKDVESFDQMSIYDFIQTNV